MHRTQTAAKVIPLRAMFLLLVEDNASDAFLLQTMLHETDPGMFAVTLATKESEAVAALAEQHFDVCLLDLSLPDATELSTLLSIQEKAPHLPILILTGTDDKILASHAVAQGAQDYLIKGYAHSREICRAISYAIERKHFESNLVRLANYDTLTELANRSLFENRLDMALARARRTGAGLAVIMMDLNRFKQINDTLGHEAGDATLKAMAVRFSECLRAYDTVARLGGDEFAVLLEDISTPRDCAVIAYKIIQAVEAPIPYKGLTITVGISIGIVNTFDNDIATTSALMQKADAAMYRAKADVHSSYHFYTEAMHAQAVARLQLEKELRAAIRYDQLTLHYQPRLMPETGRISGAEALIRWEHPQRGMLLPGEFAAIAEEIGLMPEIGRWVLKTVCADLKRWQHNSMAGMQIAVNLSAQQLMEAEFANWLQALIRHYDLNPSWLALEITEETLMQDAERIMVTLAQLETFGIRLHLDNFGRRAASLQMLRQPILSLLKLDTSLVRGMGSDSHYTELIRAIIDLAHRLGLSVSAVGVETSAQLTTLMDHRCDEVQGFAVSHPLPAEQLTAWISNRHAD